VFRSDGRFSRYPRQPYWTRHETEGTYSVACHHLTLAYSDGRRFTHSFYQFPFDENNALMIDAATYAHAVRNPDQPAAPISRAIDTLSKVSFSRVEILECSFSRFI
jgi:hypothetical protein